MTSDRNPNKRSIQICQHGAVLGAFVVWGIWTGTLFLPGVFSDPNLRFFMIAVLIVAVILVRPSGILGEERRVARSPGA